MIIWTDRGWRPLGGFSDITPRLKVKKELVQFRLHHTWQRTLTGQFLPHKCGSAYPCKVCGNPDAS